MGKGKAWSGAAIAKVGGYIADGAGPKAIVEANASWILNSVKKLVTKLKAEKPVASWKGRVGGALLARRRDLDSGKRARRSPSLSCRLKLEAADLASAKCFATSLNTKRTSKREAWTWRSSTRLGAKLGARGCFSDSTQEGV